MQCKAFKKVLVVLLAALLVLQWPTSGTLNTANAATDNTVKVIRTSSTGENALQLPNTSLTSNLGYTQGENVIRVYSGEKYQDILGVGGAITESTTSVINKLSPAKQQEIYDAYFSATGSQYSLIRTHIGSCDFSLSDYSYDDMPSGQTDYSLQNFSIQPDMDDLIPAIKRALSYNPEIKIVSAPWAPPAWMKKSGVRYGQSGTAAVILIDNSVKPECYAVYANYLTKYIQEYQKQGINIWALSIQNEAENNPKWEAATFNPDQAKAFIKNNLGPTLAQNNINTKLLIWDWDKGNDSLHGDGFINYNKKVLSDPDVLKYVWGIAFHWYAGDLWHEISGEPMWSEDFYSLDELKKTYPQIHQIATEACQEKGAHLREWTPAARYIHDIINDFKHGTEAWIDWNMVLNSNGGPTHNVDNKCHSPIMVNFNVENNTADDEIIYNPAYFVLNQFSKNIRPGSKMVQSTSNVANLDHVAVENPDKSISVFVGNNTGNDINVKLFDGMNGFNTVIKANSMTTYVYSSTANERQDKAINATATASSYESSIGNKFLPSKAVDANNTTRWASDWNNDEWLKVDLGAAYNISGVELLWENGNNNKYQIEVSQDGQTWQIVSTMNNSPAKTAHISFSPTQGRYVRFHGILRNAKYGYSIYDMKVITVQQ